MDHIFIQAGLLQTATLQKELPKVRFFFVKCVFERLHFHDATLLKKHNQLLERKVKEIFHTKRDLLINLQQRKWSPLLCRIS